MRTLLLLFLTFGTAVCLPRPVFGEKPKPHHVQTEIAKNSDAGDFVEVISMIPNIVIDLPYATETNFFKKRFYSTNRCFLRRFVVENLKKVQEELNAQGLGLKIWDGYRPQSVQYAFWKVLPDPQYVADPSQGSRHNRGAAVDLTLIDLKSGKELPMPTGYDDFSPKAAADFKLIPKEITQNRQILREAMQKHGFEVLPSEWWHFDAKGWKKYPLENWPVEQSTPAIRPTKDDKP